MRQALTADNEVAPLDEMWLHYSGNQLQSITNYANPDDFVDYTPYPVSEENNVYAYDQNGNTTKDLDRNISQIQYNLLNLPRRITYTDGSMATYTYNSLGEKLQVAYSTSRLTASLPTTNMTEKVLSDSVRRDGLRSGMANMTMDYCGNMVYNGSSLSRILLGCEGYCRLINNVPTYYYFIKDHLGSTRVVLQQNGNTIQSNQYYPYGKSWDSSYSQPYLYNGKEIDMMHDLEWYDYGARMYEPGLCRFITMDPLCEKYYNISPYAYCENNPINRIDSDGKEDYDITPDGYVKNCTSKIDRVLYFLGLRNEKDRIFMSGSKEPLLTFPKGTITEVEDGTKYSKFEIKDNKYAEEAFQAIISNSDVEWAHVRHVNGKYSSSLLVNQHNETDVTLSTNFARGYKNKGEIISLFEHSHPLEKEYKLNGLPNLPLSYPPSTYDINTTKNYPNTKFKVYDIYNAKVYEYDENGIKSIYNR